MNYLGLFHKGDLFLLVYYLLATRVYQYGLQDFDIQKGLIQYLVDLFVLLLYLFHWLLRALTVASSAPLH